MSQLKPMIIVLLMLTSAVGGFLISNDLVAGRTPGNKGERGEDGNDGLNADETRIVELELSILCRNMY